MNVQLTDEQKLLQDSVAKFCAAEIPLTKVRDLVDNAMGLTDELWQKVAEQGWLGVMVPEEFGGLALGIQELGAVCEEFGRALIPGAYLSTVLAAHAIALGGTDTAKTRWLEKVVGGEAKGALALIEETGEFAQAAIKCKAVKNGAGYLLNGTKYLVADAEAADFFIVAAITGEGAKAGLSYFAVDKNAGGVTVKPNKVSDLTSRSGQVYLNNTPVGDDCLVGTEGGAQAIYDPLMKVANVCIAAGSVAGAEYIHRLTVAYAKERTQFGKLIGSFQAVKHPLVDMFALIESARSAYHYAAWAVEANSPDVDSAVAVSRLTATEAYRQTTLVCLQMHGGIAFTWEYDLHLFLKRAKHNQYLYGTPKDYEEIICKKALGI